MAIQTIDRIALGLLAETALPALREALKPYGVTVERGRSQYSNGSTGKLVFELVVDGADPERDAFERMAPLLGIQASDYGREFDMDGTRYKLTGVDLGRPKYPFKAIRIRDGKAFKLTERAVLLALKGNEP